ncbi:hypothetical protein R9X47_00880 [Wukongibacter baidiensis]|uniref:hypothetical protein n=1 Tax=Wukongibacter baidiensis TaxID=1723361 RepID=UPI003D7FD788
MGKVIFFVFFIFFVTVVFIPNMILIDNNNDIELMKQNLNLASRAIINSIDKEIPNSGEMSDGYNKNFYYDVNIDHERLLKEFYDVLRKNIVDDNEYESVKDNVKSKILVYHDKFFIADEKDLWSPPFFFMVEHNGTDIYLNSMDDKAYYYDDTGSKVYKDISEYGITLRQKNDIIIDKVNQTVGQLTYEVGLRDGINIKILNKDNDDVNYIVQNRHFNILDGLTFFVVFVENKPLEFDGKRLDYKNYNVAGYTLEDI